MAVDSDSDCPPLELDEDTSDSPPIQFSLWKTFKPHIPRVLLTILVDVVLPMVIYLLLHKHTKSVHAFLAAGVPPLLMIIVKATVSRTFDALGFVILLAFVASAVAAVITSNGKIILLEKSLVTGMISLVFGMTLIPCRFCRSRCQIRPLAFYFYQDLVPTSRIQAGLPDHLFDDDDEYESNVTDNEHYERVLPKLSSKQEVSQVYEWIYGHCSSFRLSCFIITSIWCVGLLLEFLGRFLLVLSGLSEGKIFIYGHIILVLVTMILILLTIVCIAKERKQTLKSIEQWKDKHLNRQRDRPLLPRRSFDHMRTAIGFEEQNILCLANDEIQ